MIGQPETVAQEQGHRLMYALVGSTHERNGQIANLFSCAVKFEGRGGCARDFAGAMRTLCAVEANAVDDEIEILAWTMLADVWAMGKIGGVFDHDTAAEYYTVIAESHEFTEGPYRAGLFWDSYSQHQYERAAGPDLELADMYYSVAVDNGDARAMVRLAAVLSSPALESDENKLNAVDLYRESAEAGNIEAIEALNRLGIPWQPKPSKPRKSHNPRR